MQINIVQIKIIWELKLLTSLSTVNKFTSGSIYSFDVSTIIGRINEVLHEIDFEMPKLYNENTYLNRN